MRRMVPAAVALAVGLSCGAPASFAQEAAVTPECEVCTARHQALQALQRARLAKACAEDETADCPPARDGDASANGLATEEEDATLRLPDGRTIGE